MLTGYEKETTIVFNESESAAYIETPNRRIKQILKQLLKNHPDRVRLERDEDDEGFMSVQIPKKWVRIRGPRVLTDEQRAEYAERAKKMAAARFANKGIEIDISDDESEDEDDEG